jgi:hypothetical protein
MLVHVYEDKNRNLSFDEYMRLLDELSVQVKKKN